MIKGLTSALKYILLFLILNEKIFAHGGVFIEDDVCVIQIGFFKAHFTIYQPQTSANQEFCEDIPEVSQSLFVLDYLHDSLKFLPVDFRIIKNNTNLGRSAKWEHITKLSNLDEQTVFYQPAVIAPNGSLTAEHTFLDGGEYIGIVTTQQPGEDKIYRAVFPFRVGGESLGYLPLFIGLILLLEIYYLYSNGTLQRWYKKLSNRS